MAVYRRRGVSYIPIKMKIVCFHLFNDYSGSPKVLKNTLCGLLGKGAEIELITSRGGVLDTIPAGKNLKRRSYSYKFSNNAIVTTLRYTLVQLYTFFMALGYMRDKNAVFYINTILPAGPAIAGWLMGKKVIYHYHENATVKSGFYRLLAQIMQRTATRIICVSDYQRSFLTRRGGVCVIPNAVEEDFVKRLHPAPQEAFERKRVLMLGSLKAYKGTAEFITLARELPQFNFELVLNDEQKNVDAFCAQQGTGSIKNLAVHPRQEDVAPFYNNASLVLNLSNKELFVETFGLTALEAMNAGLPVIVPTVGGIAEMVEDGVNGFKIDVQNLTKIKNCIASTLLNQDLYLSLCNGVLERASEYSATKSAERILEEITQNGTN